MAVADVPDTPVVISGERAATLTDLLSFLCFSEHVCLDGFHGSEDDRIGATLVDDETVSDLVTVLHVLGECLFVHVLIISHEQHPSTRGGTVLQLSYCERALHHRHEPSESVRRCR